MVRSTSKFYSVRRPDGYMSGLEAKVAKALRDLEVPFEYEKHKVSYVVPSRAATYTPDFKLSNGVVVEAKGIFDTEDRQKHLLVKAQHPELDIRFVFSSAYKPIYEGSKTTYASWCDKHGFKWADKLIPPSWTK